MVVLAVTWMAKVGREAEVAPVFSKLTEESRKEPGSVMYWCIVTRPNRDAFSSMSSTRTMPGLRPIAPLPISCNTPRKNSLSWATV